MFKNIGKKIMGLARFITWMGFLASIVGGVVVFKQDEDLIVSAVLVAVVGCLVSWIACFMLFGFGRLVQNSEECKDLLKKISQQKPVSAPVTSVAPVTPVTPVAPVDGGDGGNGGNDGNGGSGGDDEGFSGFGGESFEELAGKIKF